MTKRLKTNAHIDFLGREYIQETNQTIRELAVEIRTLKLTREEIERKHGGLIQFPAIKLGECDQFKRMGKTVYIVYQLSDMILYLEFSRFDIQSFSLSEDTKWLNLPIKSFLQIP